MSQPNKCTGAEELRKKRVYISKGGPKQKGLDWRTGTS